MSRRRLLALSAAVTGAGALGACRTRVRPAIVPDLLVVQTRDGLSLLRGDRQEPVGAAVATPDAVTLRAAVPTRSGDTRLVTVDTATGRRADGPLLAGLWQPRVVSGEGDLVALTESGAQADAYHPVGRARTTIVVADRYTERNRITLDGNLVAEAFTVDHAGLFVLEWLPATAPDRYRVRVLDLATGKVQPLQTRNKAPIPPGAEEEMRGEGRQWVSSPDGTVRYTLYTHQPDHLHTRDLLRGGRTTPVHAFVHTLSLEIGWAYCIDLPDPFGHGPAAAHTLAISRDGRQLWVADLTSGHLAAIDTGNLSVTNVTGLPPGRGPAYSAATGWLYLGGGSTLRAVKPTGSLVATWDAGGDVRGLAVSPAGSRLLVGYPGAVGWRDASSGHELGLMPVPGMTELRQAA
jgi:hypothetical protein